MEQLSCLTLYTRIHAYYMHIHMHIHVFCALYARVHASICIYTRVYMRIARYIPRAIGPQDPEDFRQDRRDRTLPVGRSVWTTCGHVVSVRNELALAVRFE